MAGSGCPCPLERKVLIETVGEIVKILAQDAQNSKTCQSDCAPPKRCEAATSLTRVASQRLETALVPFEHADARPEALEACKSAELRGGVFHLECRCLRRDGLQHACRKTGCSDRCVAARRAGPACCPGRGQRQRLEYLHEKAELMKRKPPPPPLEPLPPPPPPPYNWTGTFAHKCVPDVRCPRKKTPVQYPCGGAKCKHWEVPKPCTLPICRADCFEHPPGWPTFCR